MPNAAAAAGQGLDVRTEGGYVIAPPCPHVSGRRYEWANDAPIVEAPAWLVAHIKGLSGEVPTNGRRVRKDTYWNGLAAEKVRTGDRHQTIVNLAGLLIRDRNLPAALAYRLLLCFNAKWCEEPLEESEVEERWLRIVERQVMT